LIICVDWQAAAAVGHVFAAVTALVMGAVVLGLPKGVGPHRLVGSTYVVCLVVVDVAALSVHRESTFGVFHALAVLSLLTIVAGVLPLLLGSRSLWAINTHAYCMTWSYAGLVGAGCGQLAANTAGRLELGSWAVPTVIGTVLAVSGLLIFRRVPPIIDQVTTR
jgi:uncharacterized membrane protein